MKGADQCPKCGSRKWGDVAQPVTDFYAPVIRVCGNCATAWEPFDVADLSDPKCPTDGFKEPCGNCAFRPGSTEQQDGERWRELMGHLTDPDKFGVFYCHKGVPITPGEGDGFAYPKDRNGRHQVMKLRVCRGYQNMQRARFEKAKRARQAADADPTEVAAE